VSERRAYLAWLVVCLVWGTTYLAIRIALESLPPLLMAGFRWIVAGAILIGVFALRRERLPQPASWLSLFVRGVLLIGFGNGAVVWAEQTVSSGLTSVLVAIVPFWLVGVEALHKDGESIAPRQWLGLTIGFAGIVLLIWPQLGLDVNGRAFAAGIIATQLACAGWAVGSAYARRTRRPAEVEPPRTAPAYEMFFGGVVLLACGFAAGEKPSAMITVRSAAALVYLIVFGSLLAFSAYRYAIQHLPMATVSLYAYVNTVLAMVLGALILNEHFGWRIAAGAAVVLLGIGLVKEREE
jgi:drug/metabolite transporter (DMT)-like permease